MKYIASINDETFEIEINTEGEISLEDQQLTVDFQSVAGRPVYSMLLDGRSFEAYVYPSDTGLEVLLHGQLYLVDVEDERQRRLRQASGSQITQTGEYHLKSPMPGMIITIPIEDGAQVEKGQNLIVLESMKMQNELKAPRSGTVARVRVNVGDRVEQGQILVIMS
jgi:biotin carboxyl carrier protein